LNTGEFPLLGASKQQLRKKNDPERMVFDKAVFVRRVTGSSSEELLAIPPHCMAV
jgi:hypothetical protein